LNKDFKKSSCVNMSTWGGKRVGAGRPRGAESAKTRERRQAVRELFARFELEHPDAFPGDAVALMQCVYRDQSLPLPMRLAAANCCGAV
jgi:hypothetical protein